MARRVLVIDDDTTVRTLARHVLEAEGWEVAEAVDGQRALTMLASHRPVVAVLDLMMPEVSGFDVLETRRRHRLAPETRFLVLTGRTEEGTWRRAFELGADDFLAKPFDNAKLAARVDQLATMSTGELSLRRRQEKERLDLLSGAGD
ncbi:MAG TPA: response regulator [Acidimicrobiales bacterium]|nr:response regulator [Acidimicrobiales bacterium]